MREFAQDEQEERQGKQFREDLDELFTPDTSTQCTETPGPLVEESAEADLEESHTPDTSTHCSVTPGPPVEESAETDANETESTRQGPTRRAVSITSDSVLLNPPRVVSVLNLQVLPPRHTYDPHYTIRHWPLDTGPLMPDQRRETSQMELGVAVQQTARAPLRPGLLFSPHYSRPQLYGPYGPLQPLPSHYLGSSPFYQTLGPPQ
ncbi:hypothetical protein WMY93_018806 [Mugilogobius chulae]|uniref:Uncharacterized protein n=1 Tax=Mugilogobius chulae TaxID=88201 RepID=A0AAW0NPT9_9GOBI